MATRRKRRKGIGNLERRGDSYRVRLCVAGKRHTFTVPTTDRTIARQAAKAKRDELRQEAARRLLGKPAAITFSALLRDYERIALPRLAPGGQRSYRDSFRPFQRYFVEELGDPVVSAIRPADVHDFLAWRANIRFGKRVGKVSKHTVARDRRVLHRLFNFAVEMEYLDANPVARVPEPKGDPRTPHILSEDEYERLLKECSSTPMLRLYVLLLAETGLRAYSEALRLRWEDVDLDNGFLQVVSGRDDHRTKSGRSRWVPLTQPLQTALQEHSDRYRRKRYKGRPSPWVFHHHESARHYMAGDRIQDFHAAFKRALRRAALPHDLRQHDLRHRRVTTWLADGKSPVLVQEAVGHSAIQTTLGYTHLAREHLRALV